MVDEHPFYCAGCDVLEYRATSLDPTDYGVRCPECWKLMAYVPPHQHILYDLG